MVWPDLATDYDPSDEAIDFLEKYGFAKEFEAVLCKGAAPNPEA
jgi:hypothetical protein